MKIIIVGAGRIGTSLAKSLAQEKNDVYLIERDEDVAQKSDEKLDVKVIVGPGADPDTLQKANAAQADLVLAVTPSDEVNLVVCAMAGNYGAKRCIARVRNTGLSRAVEQFGYDQFQLEQIINPELVAAQAIRKIVEAPGASEVADFADGTIFLRAFDISSTSPLCGLKIHELRDEDFPWPFVIVSLVRRKTVIIPKGDTTIEAGDHIYVLLPSSSLGEFLTVVKPEVKLPQKIIIYGATIIGTNVAFALSKKVKDILMIEEDEELAKDTAACFEDVRVIHGSASEQDILMECGVEAADVFIATSLNDQANLVSSVLAKKMGAKSAIIAVQHQDFLPVVHALGIDALINPHHLAIEQILRSVRGKGINAVTKFFDGEMEALEFIPEEGSPVTKGPLSSIKFPKNAIVGAIYRGKEVILARGADHIHPGEKVVVFSHQTCVKQLQELFTSRRFF